MRENAGFLQQRCGSGGDIGNFKAEKMWRGMAKSPARSSAFLVFTVIFIGSAFVATTFLHRSAPPGSAFITQITETTAKETSLVNKTVHDHGHPINPKTAAKRSPKMVEYPLICIGGSDWIQESQQGYKQSDLASQCRHRYGYHLHPFQLRTLP
ncbi:hypothetical protein V2J09_022777 [Rumex salicifolius]